MERPGVSVPILIWYVTFSYFKKMLAKIAELKTFIKKRMRKWLAHI